METIKEKLTRAVQLQTELDKISNEITPLLSKYSTSRHYALVDISQITFCNDLTIYFTASGNCWGYFDEYFSVSLDYFDDPQKYIDEEKIRLKL